MEPGSTSWLNLLTGLYSKILILLGGHIVMPVDILQFKLAFEVDSQSWINSFLMGAFAAETL